MDFEIKREFYNLKYGKCYLIDEKEKLYLVYADKCFNHIFRAVDRVCKIALSAHSLAHLHLDFLHGGAVFHKITYGVRLRVVI